MGLVIKKKNLKWIIITIICVMIGGGVGTILIKKYAEEKTAERVYKEQLQTAYNREFKSLLREYERYKESFEESYSSRDYYRKEINKLVGEYVLKNEYSHRISDSEHNEIIRLLKIKAWSKAYGFEE
ncbi:MAG: hypothetical protein U0L77_09705 [Prevotellamassilia sp.]|nr:hypothetical protein [Prevotellamassilia sp.]